MKRKKTVEYLSENIVEVITVKTYDMINRGDLDDEEDKTSIGTKKIRKYKGSTSKNERD